MLTNYITSQTLQESSGRLSDSEIYTKPRESKPNQKLRQGKQTQEVTDLDGPVVTADGGVDGEMSIHEPHLLPESSGHTGDEVIDVAKSRSDGGAGFALSKPRIDLKLRLPTLLVLDQLEIEVQMLEIADELAARSFDA